MIKWHKDVITFVFGTPSVVVELAWPEAKADPIRSAQHIPQLLLLPYPHECTSNFREFSDILEHFDLLLSFVWC
jgi:hypothetical protein